MKDENKSNRLHSCESSIQFLNITAESIKTETSTKGDPDNNRFSGVLDEETLILRPKALKTLRFAGLK